MYDFLPLLGVSANMPFIFQNAPQQENGYDCGVFSCQYMECLSRGADFDFDQTNMPYLRQRMILEIVRGKLWEQ